MTFCLSLGDKQFVCPSGGQTFLIHRRAGWAYIFHTQGGTNIFHRGVGLTFFHRGGGTNIFVGGGGGYDDVNK